MNIFDKIKILLALKKLVTEVLKVSKIKALWDKLSGTKTITGLALIVAYYALPSWDIHLPSVVLDIGVAWAGVGFAHKFDKVTGILSKVLEVLTKANDTINKGS